MHYASKSFWVNAADRAVRTFAQTLLVVLGADQIGITQADWQAALGMAAMGAVLSVLTSLATPTTVEEGAASAYEAKHAKR